MSRRWTDGVLVGGLLLLLCAATYGPALRGDFFWDDLDYVRDNPTLRTAEGLRQIWFDPSASPQYYPLSFTSFWLEYQAWGARPTGYHVANVMLHGANCFLLWALLRSAHLPGALLAAAIFAAHPSHVESVAWISERKDVLSGFFYLLALLAWLRFLDRWNWRTYAWALACFLCALLSKTMTATLPAALLVVAWWRDPTQMKRIWPYLVPFVALGVGAAGLTTWREHMVQVDKSPLPALAPLSAMQRLLLWGRSFWWHAGKTVWPANLMRIYPRWDVKAGGLWPYAFPFSAVSVPAVLYFCRSRIGRGPVAAAALFGVTLLPVSGVVPFKFEQFSYVADHFGYLPGIGLIVLLAVTSSVAVERLQVPHGMVVAGAVGLIGALAVLSREQAALYADPLTLWRDTIARNPAAVIAYNEAGRLLGERGDFDGELAQYEAAVRVDPAYAPAQSNLASALARKGNSEAAISRFLAALSLQPGLVEAHYNLAAVLANVGRIVEAEPHLVEAVRLKPQWGVAWDSLGIVALRLGRRDEATRSFSEAVRQGYAPARAHLASISDQPAPP